MVAVEGYVDVIAMVTAGFEAAVAPLGTALTEDQLALLWKMADEPVLCFDGDGAGRRAAYRAVDLALPHCSRASAAVRAPARRAGPGRSRPLRRARGDQRGDRLGAPARRHAVAARDRGGRLRHAGAARRARPAHRRGDQRDRRSVGAQVLPAGSGRARRALFAPARDGERQPARWEGRRGKPRIGWKGRGRTPSRREVPGAQRRAWRRARSCAASAARCRRARR